ncbi:HNH endonuclease [Methylomonas sp. YC3]
MKPSTQMTSKVYAGTGHCIYCLKQFSKEQLTDEHIIPLALNGTLIIRDAACDSCRAISNEKYENPALQADLLVPRLLLGLKRRKKNQKKHMPTAKLGNHLMDEGGKTFNTPLMTTLKHLLWFIFCPQES